MEQIRLKKHINCTDTAIEIVKIHNIPELDYLIVKVMWWNVGNCHAPWCMGITEKLKIKRGDWHNWKPYRWENTCPTSNK